MPLDSSNYDISIARPDVYSLEGLIAWLETQNPETEYDFCDCDGACLLDQYLTARGQSLAFGQYTRMASITSNNIAGNYYDVACEMPWTFGAALLRARAIRRREGSGR